MTSEEIARYLHKRGEKANLDLAIKAHDEWIKGIIAHVYDLRGNPAALEGLIRTHVNAVSHIYYTLHPAKGSR